jgi:Uma2 family endonuclease
MRLPRRRDDPPGSDGKPLAQPRPGGSGGRWNGYPTSDGKPTGETDWHRKLMNLLIEMLEDFFAGRRVYVSGNLLLFYERGNRRRHLSPDVFVVRGVDHHLRDNYLLWEERRAPQVVIEVTSASTRSEDQTTKRTLYQDTLKVREYFLFDPYGEWLDPQLKGYRLHQGVYQPIRPRHGRLVSQELKLHLEGDGEMLRLWDPRSQAWLPTRTERLQQEMQEREEAERRAEQATRAQTEAEAERDRMKQELEELRHRLNKGE